MITWIAAKYGSAQYAKLASGLNIEVGLDGVPTRNGPALRYVAKVFDATLAKRFDTVDEAKAAAERAAKAFLTKALLAFE